MGGPCSSQGQRSEAGCCRQGSEAGWTEPSSATVVVLVWVPPPGLPLSPGEGGTGAQEGIVVSACISHSGLFRRGHVPIPRSALCFRVNQMFIVCWLSPGSGRPSAKHARPRPPGGVCVSCLLEPAEGGRALPRVSRLTGDRPECWDQGGLPPRQGAEPVPGKTSLGWLL